MSEYRWWTRHAWIGVQNAEGKLLGVIARSGVVRALGHFCHVTVHVNGKEKIASNQEARIFPFHSITLEPGEREPKYILRALGWCKDGNTYAYRHVAGGYLCKLDGHFNAGDKAFGPVSQDDFKPETKAALDALLYPKPAAAEVSERSNPCPSNP
jgi:hypothetical protein